MRIFVGKGHFVNSSKFGTGGQERAWGFAFSGGFAAVEMVQNSAPSEIAF